MPAAALLAPAHMSNLSATRFFCSGSLDSLRSRRLRLPRAIPGLEACSGLRFGKARSPVSEWTRWTAPGCRPVNGNTYGRLRFPRLAATGLFSMLAPADLQKNRAHLVSSRRSTRKQQQM